MFPKTQNAWTYHPSSNTVQLIEKNVPALQPHQVLVRNQFIGINPVDWKFIASNPLDWKEGHIPGVDGCGTIVAIGADVSPEVLHQRIAYHTSLHTDGSFAEYTIIDQDRFLRIPASLDGALAAALPCPMLTAWQAFEKIPVPPGRSVLVAGMGAVHTVLVQLLQYSGMVVDVISASLDENHAKTLGIHRVFRSIEAVEPGYYAVFDAVGKENAQKLVPLLKANGHMICTQDRIEQAIDPAFSRTISYHEVALGALHIYGDTDDRHALMANGAQLIEQVNDGVLQVSRPKVFPFADMPAALAHSETQKIKTVVAV